MSEFDTGSDNETPPKASEPLPHMRNVLPVDYDPQRRLVIFDSPCILPPASFANLPEREGWTRGTKSAVFFVKEAITNYLRYDRKSELLWAIENDLPEVYENPDGRRIFAELVKKYSLTKRGQRKELAFKIDKEEENAFKLVWYYIGQGYPVIANSENSRNKDTACSLAGQDINKSPQTIHKIYTKFGGDKPEGVFGVIAHIAKAALIKPSIVK